jgi:hypothetical protein
MLRLSLHGTLDPAHNGNVVTKLASEPSPPRGKTLRVVD